MSNIERIKQELLAWAGLRRGTLISEEAMPRFHEIIGAMDQVEALPHEHRFHVTASSDAVVRWCVSCSKSQVLRKSPVAAMWVDISEPLS